MFTYLAYAHVSYLGSTALFEGLFFDSFKKCLCYIHNTYVTFIWMVYYLWYMLVVLL